MLKDLKEQWETNIPDCKWFESFEIQTVHVPLQYYGTAMTQLRLIFAQMTDLTVVDWLTYGQSSWRTISATHQGFSRAQLSENFSQARTDGRFEVVVHLLSYPCGTRLRIRCMLDSNLALPSITPFWSAANWYEREVFDLFGVVFQDHPDLRRILTDYGFTGYPLRKDFPMLGYDQVIYDASLERCRLEPVNIVERIVTPRIIRGAPFL